MEKRYAVNSDVKLPQSILQENEERHDNDKGLVALAVIELPS